MDRFDKLDMQIETAKAFEWKKWDREIPYISFPDRFEVKIIPPFGGAMVRFTIRDKEYKDTHVSVYLDCYEILGIYGGDPYWEIYPDVDGDVYRCGINETEELIKRIEISISKQIEDIKEEECQVEKLNTIQKREKLNDVFAMDDKGNGGAYHRYLIVADKGLQVPKEVVLEFQNGARNTEGATEGIIDSDLLEIVRHRLQCFQNGDYATRENEMALNHIKTALLWMNKRVEDRIERNVLGTMNK